VNGDARHYYVVTTASRNDDPMVTARPWPYGGPSQLRPHHSTVGRKVTSIRSAPGHRERPAQAADVAQAHLFDEILQSEIAELEEIAEAAERQWLQRRVRGVGEDSLPEALVRLGERVAEAHRLLSALRERFPRE
jgi:hypothetical protein